MLLPDEFDFWASPLLVGRAGRRERVKSCKPYKTLQQTRKLSLRRQVSVLCTGAVFWVHSRKKQPDEASRLRKALWGIRFRPFGQQQQLLIAASGAMGLLFLAAE